MRSPVQRITRGEEADLVSEEGGLRASQRRVRATADKGKEERRVRIGCKGFN